MSQILSAEDRQRISARVAEIEKNTAGELVVVISSDKGSYQGYRAIGAALLTWLLATIASPFVPWEATEWIGVGQLPVAMVLFWLLGWNPILRRLVPKAAQARTVSTRAKALFLELGVTETRDRSGVLLLVAEVERRVEILADRGIHQEVGIQGWQGIVAPLIDALRAGRAREGIEAAISEIGRDLAAKFPARPDDTNELPNEVVMDRG